MAFLDETGVQNLTAQIKTLANATYAPLSHTHPSTDISGLTDEKVQQINTTSNVGYPVILANSANTTTETAGVKKSSILTFNPSTKELVVDNSSNVSYVSSTGFSSQTGDNSVFLNPSELVFTDNSAYTYIGEQVTAGVYNWINTSKTSSTLRGIGLNTRVASQYKSSFETGPNGIRLYKYASESSADGSIQSDNYVTDHVQITSGSVYLRTYTYDETTTGGSVNEILHITPTYIDIGTTNGGSSRITKNKIDKWDNYTDTKNTAGSTNTSSKIFLVGATSQAANPQTYSQDTAYVGTNGHLYSNSKQVVNITDQQTITNKTLSASNIIEAGATVNNPAITSSTVSVSQSTWGTTNTAYVDTDKTIDFVCRRWGPVIMLYIRFTTGATGGTSTTRTFFTPADNYKPVGLYYCQVNASGSPYAQVTGASFWFTSAGILQGRAVASTEYRISCMYLLNN